MTKGIPQRIVDEMDKEFRDSSYNMLDKVEATAYHPKAYGLTLEEWISFIEDYAKDQLCFGMPLTNKNGIKSKSLLEINKSSFGWTKVIKESNREAK